MQNSDNIRFISGGVSSVTSFIATGSIAELILEHPMMCNSNSDLLSLALMYY